eukprot:TRINITY_DN33054_c0_g1_i1.p1 TRINITY_DN33054_c0_g1~~TRINITY_DN33054_c0_g1_i1.p1  ORF type:complete len:634 (+),score=111.93 TRINITY_DN33054_c0_g1_i1:93-1904(+)
MVKRALCIGCNYPSKAFGLAGAVNDAFLIAETLQVHLGFRHENICVLHDVYPGQKKSLKVEPAKCPTRVNILHQLQVIVRNTRPGDVLFFSFSGYGLQVDDMDGFQDEGYDEAILPTDFVDGREGDYSVIVTNDIHDILLGVPANVVVTVLMDCDHATSLIDVGGTMDGSLVNGLKFSNFCGMKAHSAKMTLANHDRDVWQEEKARSVKARPRFQPVMEIDNPRKGRLPTRPGMSRSSAVAFCFAAAGHGQTAMEMQMTVPGVDGQEATQKQYGVLSWCFVRALEELRYQCSFYELLEETRKQMQRLKSESLPRMDQEVLMTFAAPLSKPKVMRALQPLEGVFPPERGISGGGGAGGVGHSMRLAPPTVVPPPPPGFITNQAGASGSGPASASRQASEDLPPPPPGPGARAPQRCASELVHHNVEGREGGSFQVQGASYAPPPRGESYGPTPREVSRASSESFRPHPCPRGESIGDRQLPAPPPPMNANAQKNLPLPPPPPPVAKGRSAPQMSSGGSGGWPAPTSPSSRAGQASYPGQPAPNSQPAGFPIPGLTPPDLFGRSGPPSLSFSVPGYGEVTPGQANASNQQQKASRLPFSSPLMGR